MIAGGSQNGYLYFIDSNFDLGQDVLLFKKWLKQHPEIKGLHVKMRDRLSETFFLTDNFPVVPYYQNKILETSELLEALDKNNESNYRCQGPLPGWFAISTQQIMERRKHYRYFLELKPEYRIEELLKTSCLFL
jgi:hypothetical protein